MHFTNLKSGLSVEGSEINAFRTHIDSKKYIYLLAGVHGDEVEGVHVLNQIVEELKHLDDIELPIIVVPILNRDGYRAGTRVNANGVDLNRNCPSKSWSSEVTEDKYHPGTAPGSEPENKFLFKLMDKFAPGIILSFHSWKPCVNYNGDCEDLAQKIASLNNYEAVADIGYPTPGSLGDYGPENYGSPVITFECPVLGDGPTLDDIWRENKHALTQIFKDNSLKRFI